MGIDAETYAAAKAYVDKEVEGGGGTLDYEALRNHPSINGNELVGNKSSKQLGMQNLFTGTTAEWAQLTADQKAQYTHVCFTDDESDLTFDNVPTEGSNNPVKSDGIYDSEKDIYAVMGEMCAKNLNLYPYYNTTKTENGVTFIDNGDGTVTMSTVAGGATATTRFVMRAVADNFCLKKGVEYILTDGTSDSGSNTYMFVVALYNGNSYINIAYGTTNGVVKFTLPDNNTYDRFTVYITVYKDTIRTTPVLFKPMFRLASDTDDTYQQYAKTNKQLTDDVATNTEAIADNTGAIEAIVNEYGAKNLLPVTLSNLKANNTDGTWSGNTYTYRDVTYTCTTSGDIVTSITMNGMANSAGDSLITIPMACHAGKWLANGGTADSSSTTYGAFVSISSGVHPYVYDEDVEINLNSDDTINYIIYTRTGQTCSNVTFYPMIRDARITDPTYVPYAMTNAELTDAVNNIETLQTIYPSMLLTGSITIKQNCGVKFIVADNLILTTELASGDFIELCTAGTVLNPPVVTTEFLLHAASGGVNIAPVNLIMSADGSIYVKNYSSSATLLYAHCCGAYI